MFGPKPTTWTFDLDARATNMSLVPIAESGTPVFATPTAVNELIGTFSRTASTPDEVLELLDMSRKLLATSVIHYEFAAVGAVIKAVCESQNTRQEDLAETLGFSND